MPNIEKPVNTEQVIIHIGWHKSASTFLQEGFFQQLDVNYQPLKGIPDRVRSRMPQYSSIINFVESHDDFDPLLMRSITDPKLNGSSSKTTIISQEQVSGHPHGYSIINPGISAYNLAKAYPNAKIIAVIRNQFDYILSLYSYRVAIRGHESRSLTRFVNEDRSKGLVSHVEYDRLIGQYVDLFGARNVLILPVEMLQSDSKLFFLTLSEFIGCRAPTEPPNSTSNESTRLKTVLRIWIPLNFIFSLTMKLALRLLGKSPSEYEPDKQMIYPFVNQRLRYYRFKRRITVVLNRLFAHGQTLNKEDIPSHEDLDMVFSSSNKRLMDLDVIGWDMGQLGYPISKKSI